MNTPIARASATADGVRQVGARARSLLDGRRFDGIVLEPNKTAEC